MKYDINKDRRYQVFSTFATVLADPSEIIEQQEALKASGKHDEKLEDMQRLTNPELFFDEYEDRDEDELTRIAEVYERAVETTIEKLADELRRQTDEDDDPEISETLEMVDMYVGMIIRYAHKSRNAKAMLS